MKQMNWYLYILKCADESLYTGITTDIPRRIEQHTAGTGAKYTKGRGPFQLVYRETCEDKAAASRREWEIKRLNRADKLKLFS